jgi:hypothetical protein
MSRHKTSEQCRLVTERLNQRDSYASEGEWLTAVVATATQHATLESDTLDALISRLRGHYGAEYTKIGDEHDAHTAFWKSLAEAFADQPVLRAIYADTLLISGADRATCLAEFLAAVEAAPQLFPEFAGDFYDVAKDLGRDRFLDYRLAELRFAVTDDDDDDEYVRELTRDLLTEFGTDTETIARIRAVASGSG